MADADQMADVLDPFEAAARRVRQGVRPEAGRQAGAATHVIENYLPYVLGKAASLPQRAMQAAGDLQRYGDVYDPAPAFETAQMMMGRTPFAEPGSAGVFGGMLAKTADLNALSKAKEMIPQGRAAVWKETGWAPGADTKWRFEIPDQPSMLKHEPVDYLKRYSDESLPLHEVLHHPSLYEAYPHLKGVEVSGMEPGAQYRGMYRHDEENPGMLVNFNRPMSDVKSTILHELQHGAQYAEDFAPGANTEWVRHKLAPKASEIGGIQNLDAASMLGYRRHAGEVEARTVQERYEQTPEYLRAHQPFSRLGGMDTPISEHIIPSHYIAKQSPELRHYLRALMAR